MYLPDLLAIASFYKDWAKWGGGISNKGILDYGDFPTVSGDPSTNRWKGGAVLDGKLNEVQPVDLRDPKQIQEYVTHSWYEYAEGNQVGVHPWDGETTPKFSGPKPPFEFLEMDRKYSWMKRPRWRGHAMEGGPLARLLLALAYKDEEVKADLDASLRQLDVPLEAAYSTLGRVLARGLETRRAGRMLKQSYEELVANVKAGDTQTANMDKWDPATWPAEELKGVGAYLRASGAGPLGEDQGPHDLQLSGRSCDYLERLAQGRHRPARSHGSRARRVADPRSAEAVGNPAGDPLL